jgi:hypothetical protein
MLVLLALSRMLAATFNPLVRRLQAPDSIARGAAWPLLLGGIAAVGLHRRTLAGPGNGRPANRLERHPLLAGVAVAVGVVVYGLTRKMTKHAARLDEASRAHRSGHA